MERSYIAFISYKHTERDAAIAKQVHTLIENYVIPKSLRKDGKKLGIVFRDEEELPISSDLTESICTALDASRYLIVICSPEAKESPWVAREVNYFLRNHDARDAFVVLADGEPNDVFPYELTHVLNKSTGEYQDVEPLAMDVRADSVGASLKKARAHIKKLYAGMLGCSYDSLVQREKTRKLRRLIALAALCVLLAGSFIGMLFVKNRELSRKNDELTAAIELALNRESELLVGQADEALQSGDVAAAIKYASAALYSEDIERPYYAPAERALFSAIDIFQEIEDTPMLSKVALKHHTPIEMMACSPDSSVVYTIDAYGVVSSFDSSSGDLLWTVKIKENDGLFTTAGAEPQLWYGAESGILACYYDNILTGLDALTGRTAWQTEFDYSFRSGLYFDAAGQKLAYIGVQYLTNLDDYLQSRDEYIFTVFSIRDGSLLNTIPIMRMSGFDSVSFDTYSNNQSSGVFADSDRFVGTLFKTEGNKKETLLYTVDLLDNTVSFIENETLDSAADYLRTFYLGNDRALVLSNKSDVDLQTGFFLYQLRLQCFDLKAGSLLWENAVEPAEFISSESQCYIVPGQKSIVIGAGANMLVVDRDSGEVLASTTLKAEIIGLQSLADGLFAFTLADGYCAIGWRSQGDLCDSRLYSATVDLPDTPEVLLHNGGLIQVYFTGNKLDGFSILPLQEGGGSVIYLSEDRCIAYVASAVPNPVLPEPIIIQPQDSNSNAAGEFIDMNQNGTVLIGPVGLPDGKGLNVVDTANHTFTTIELDGSVSALSAEFYLTGDNRNVIACTTDGYIHRISADGDVEALATGEHVVLVTVGDTNFVASKYESDAARQAADGRIIAASCDGEQIRFWTDGKDETVIQVPEDIRWAVVDDITMPNLFRVGENGIMLLSDFASAESTDMDSFAVYNLSSKEWKQIDDVAHGTYERLIAFGQNSPVFAVYDADMNIRIYDCNAAELTHCIYTELPMVSVLKIGMLFDDQCMYVLTRDGQFIIYSVETNEMMFRTLLSDVYGAASVSIWLDGENDRLYIGVATRVFCFDVRSWEQLFSAKDFKFYSPAQNEVYVYSRDYGTSAYSLKAIPIPTTSGLIDIALDALH